MDAADDGAVTGTFRATETLNDVQMQLLLFGGFFIQLNTEGNEQGELRGQIVSIRSDLFDAILFVQRSIIFG
jgi:hypothetical protein